MKFFYKERKTLGELYEIDNSILAWNDALPTQAASTTIDALILRECSELDTLAHTATEFKNMFTQWAASHSAAWAKVAAALAQSYDPLSNYDRTESESISTTGRAQTGSSSSTQRGGTNTTVHSRQGFNSADYVPSDKDVETPGETASSEANALTQTTGGETRQTSISGNIGVTTSQEMAQQEIELREDDIYHIILKSFRRELCVGVW